VVAPTRELAQQIFEVAQLVLRRYVHLVPGMLTGGQNRAKEKARLRKGLSVVVATPGRLLDHLQQTQAFRCDRLAWLVLDEADRLLDMGFEQQLGDILAALDAQAEAGDASRGRQTVLLSATLHKELGRLTGLALRKPLAVGFRCAVVEGAVKISEEGEAGAAEAAREEEGEVVAMPSQLKQHFLEVHPRGRLATLVVFLGQQLRGEACKMVLFLATCDGVEFHHSLLGLLQRRGTLRLPCPVLKLHGNLTQEERRAAFAAFARAPRALLLCTDVAARGLDFPHVTSIVQYDAPGAPEEYVHRVGRTARAGKGGASFLFLQPGELAYLRLLEEKGASLQRYDVDASGSAGVDGGQQGGGKKKKPLSAYEAQRELQAGIVAAVDSDAGCRDLAADAFRAYVRAYGAAPAQLKAIFHVRKLHLGQVASSFGLKERPTTLGKSASKAAMKKRKYEEKRQAMHGRKKAAFLSTE